MWSPISASIPNSSFNSLFKQSLVPSPNSNPPPGNLVYKPPRIYSSATSICFLSFIRMPYTRRLKRCIEKNYSEDDGRDLNFYTSIKYSFGRSAKPYVSEFAIIYPVKFYIQSATQCFYF